LAMAELNEHDNACSSPEEIQEALSSLWKFIAERGELGAVAIPVIGTGRGRLDVPRRKVIEWIAQSHRLRARVCLLVSWPLSLSRTMRANIR
jgi:hypothetical protein